MVLFQKFLTAMPLGTCWSLFRCYLESPSMVCPGIWPEPLSMPTAANPDPAVSASHMWALTSMWALTWDPSRGSPAEDTVVVCPAPRVVRVRSSTAIPGLPTDAGEGLLATPSQGLGGQLPGPTPVLVPGCGTLQAPGNTFRCPSWQAASAVSRAGATLSHRLDPMSRGWMPAPWPSRCLGRNPQAQGQDSHLAGCQP